MSDVVAVVGQMTMTVEIGSMWMLLLLCWPSHSDPGLAGVASRGNAVAVVIVVVVVAAASSSLLNQHRGYAERKVRNRRIHSIVEGVGMRRRRGKRAWRMVFAVGMVRQDSVVVVAAGSG